MAEMTEIKTKPLRTKKIIRNICPYCNKPYKFKVDIYEDLREDGLTSILIKPHASCRNFLIFIDPNGNMRGSQCIDADLKQDKQNIKQLEKDFRQYVRLFEDQENISDFYYILEIENGNLSNKGVITSRKVEYHRLARTQFFREWIKKIYSLNKDFGFMYLDDLFIVTVNLYDMILFTIGISINNFDTSIKLDDLKSMVDFVKQKAVTLGEKILS